MHRVLRTVHRWGSTLKATPRRVAALVLSLLLLALTWVVVAAPGLVNDAYSYIDEFDDNNGVDTAASSNFQNIGGLLQATASVMTVQSPCFSLPQPAGGTFNNWLFMDVGVSQLANTNGNQLVVESCSGTPLLTRGSLVPGTTSLDLSGIPASETQLRLRWVVGHTVSPALGGTPARLDFWKVYGNATGPSRLTLTSLATVVGTGNTVTVQVSVASTGAITRNAVLRIPMGEVNGLSATGTAVAPDDGLVSDAEKDYGNGAGLKVYRPLILYSWGTMSSGTAATNALVAGGTAGELRYNLGDLPSGYSGTVNLVIIVPQGTVLGSTAQLKAYLDHGAAPANTLSGLVTKMSPSALTQTITLNNTSNQAWTVSQYGSTGNAGPGQTNIQTWFAPYMPNGYGVDAENVVLTLNFAAGTCTPIYNSYSMAGSIPSNFPYRILQEPTRGAVADKTLIIQFDRMAYDSWAGGANPWRITPNYSVPATCANGSTVSIQATAVFGNPNRTASVTKTHNIQLNYCRQVAGNYPVRISNGNSPLFSMWPNWTEYYRTSGSMKAGEWLGWYLYGSDGAYVPHTVKLDRSHVLFTMPAWGTFHGLAETGRVSRIYKDSTGTAPLPTEAGFVALADPPHAAWKPVTATDIGTTPFSAAPNDNNPSAVVPPGTRLLFVKFDDNPVSTAPDYAGFSPVLVFRVADGSYGVPEPAENTNYATALNGRTYTFETVSNPAGVARDCGAFLGTTSMIKEDTARPIVTEGHNTTVPAGQAISVFVYPRNHKLASAYVKGKWVLNLYAARNFIDLASVSSANQLGTVPPGGSAAGVTFTPPDPTACLAATSSSDPACMAVFTVPDNTQPAPAYGGTSAANTDTDHLVNYGRFNVNFNVLRNVPAGTNVTFTAELRSSDLTRQGGDNPAPTSRHAASNYFSTGSATVLESPSIKATLAAPANWPAGSSFSYQWRLENNGNTPSNGFYGVLRLPRSGVGGSQFTPTYAKAYLTQAVADVLLEASTDSTCFANPTSGTWANVPLQASSRNGYVSESTAAVPAATTCLRLRRNGSGSYTFLAGNVVDVALDVAIPLGNDGKVLSARALSGAATAWGSSSAFGPVETADASTTVSSVVVTGGSKTFVVDTSRAGYVRWTLTYRNRSGVAASNVSVVDTVPAQLIYAGLASPLPAGLSCLPADCSVTAPSGDGSGGQVRFEAAALSANDGVDGSGSDEGTVDLWMRVKTGVADGTAVSNCLTTSPGASGVGSNACTTVTTAKIGAVLVQTVVPSQGGSPPIVFPNDVLRYTLTLTNNNASAMHMRVQDVLPANTSFVPGSFKVGGVAASDTYFTAGVFSYLSANAVAAAATHVLQFDVRVGATTPNLTDIFQDMLATACSDNLSTATCQTAKTSNTVQARVNATGAISGTVYEDLNYGGGVGRSLATSSGVVRAGARVELYDDNGAFLSATTTNASGFYNFSNLSPITHTVRVVNGTVLSSRTGATSAQLPVQTWRADASTGAAVADTARVGGEAPEKVDAASNTTNATLASLSTSGVTPQSISPVRVTTGTVSGVNFGFNFSTIVNTNDSGQGSLRQWIVNANALGGQASLAQAGFGRTVAGASMALPVGVESTIFMIPPGTAVPGLRAGVVSPLVAGVAVIRQASLLPDLNTSNVAFDATTQTANGGDTNPGTLGPGGTVGVSAVALPVVQKPEVQLQPTTARYGNHYFGLTTRGVNARIRGFAAFGFGISNNTGFDLRTVGDDSLVEGNVAGTSATSFSDPGAGLRSVYMGIQTNGHNAVVQNNLVGWTGLQGIYINAGNNALVSGNTVQATDQSLTGCCGDGILVSSGTGTTVSANLVTGGGSVGLDLVGASQITATENTITGNGRTAGSEPSGVWVKAQNSVLERNVIANNYGPGVVVKSAITLRMSRNAMYGNGNGSNWAGAAGPGELGIDLGWRNGATGPNANNGAKDAALPNAGMDHPVFTTAALSGGNLRVEGYIGNGAASAVFAGATVEVFLSDNDASGYGEGQAYIGTVVADATGAFAGTLAVPGGVALSVGGKLTATATDATGNTSEFGPNATVGVLVSGTVFEDVNYGGGAGRSLAASAGVGLAGARVELYDATGNFVSATTTDSSGAYRLGGAPGVATHVRVVGASVWPSRTGRSAATLGVLTYRTNAATGLALPVTDHVGGTNPAASEPGAASAGTSFNTGTFVFSAGLSGTAQSVTPATPGASGISGLDFGFHFTTVSNTNPSGPGSLAQAITNANTLGGDSSLATAGRTAGIEHLVFMVSNGTAAPGLRSSNNFFNAGAATITPGTGLPTVSSPLVIDAQTQPGWTANPIVELNGTGAGNQNGLVLNAAGTVVRGLVVNRWAYAGIRTNADATVQGNWLGTTTSGMGAAPNGQQGLEVAGGTALVGGTSVSERNVLSGNAGAGLVISSGAAHTVQGNYIGLGQDGIKRVANTGLYGIEAYGSGGYTIGGTAAGAGNTISGQTGSAKGGLYLCSNNNVVQGNRIGTTADGTAAVANTGPGLTICPTATGNTIGGAAAGAGNLLSGNSDHGVYIMGGSNTVRGNRIGTTADGMSPMANLQVGLLVASAAGVQTIGGPGAGEGNLISGNSGGGLRVQTASAAGTTVQGNIIGLNAAGTAAIANGSAAGLVLNNGATGVLVGGTAAGAGNVISGNLARGVYVSSGSHTFQGNRIGTNAAVTAAVPNAETGLVVDTGAGAQTIGGTAAGAGNVIAGNLQSGIWVGPASGTVIQGNAIGANADGTVLLPNGFYGIRQSTNPVTSLSIGGTAAGAGNLITANGRAGVLVEVASTGVAILGNRIHGNGNQGIDLAPGATQGSNANDGAKTAGAPNLLMDSPVITSGRTSGNQLTVAGHVGSAPGQSTFANARVEVFIADTSANPQGKTYLGFVTTDASGNFSGDVAVPGGVTPGSTRVVGTATDGSGNTSEFGAATVIGFSLTGTVFDDRHYGGGAGRTLATSGGTGTAGATVELYDGGGNFLRSATTAAGGSYAFHGLGAGNYFVRVVGPTVVATRSGGVSGLLGVMTFRTTAATGTALPQTDHVGGTNPALADPGAASVGTRFDTTSLMFLTGLVGTAQHVTPVNVSTDGYAGLDFGFHFTTVTNTNDSGPGSLRQAITNANALGDDASLAAAGRTAGIEHVVFMLPNGSNAPGLRSGFNTFATSAGSYNVATIAPNSGLPAFTGPLAVDAQAQPGWTSAPVVELNGAAAGVGGVAGLVPYSGSTVRGLVINRFSDSGVLLSGVSGVTVQGNRIGTNAAGTAASPNGTHGISVYNAPNNTLGGTNAAAGNLLSGNTNAGVSITGTSSGNTLLGNTIGLNAAGDARLANGTQGVFTNAGATVIGGTVAGARNVIAGNTYENVNIAALASGTTLRGNYIGTTASGTAGITNGNEGIYVNGGPTSVVIGGTTAGAGNVIAGMNGRGVVVGGAGTGSSVLGNSIFGNSSLGIDLAYDGPTANDGAKPSTSPNLGMDYPVLRSARLTGSTLAISGFVGTAAGQSLFANARVEVFVSDAATSGSQGKTYLGFVTTDASGNFSGSLTGVSGLVAGSTRLTATATDAAGNTSEFSPGFLYGSVIEGRVFEDVNYGGGAGRSLADSSGTGTAGATVEMYDSSGNWLRSTTTASNGSYSFEGMDPATYLVRVAGGSVRSTRSGSTGSLLGVLTFRTNAASGTVLADGNQVGGSNPAVADAATATTGTVLNPSTLAYTAGITGQAQAVTTVAMAAPQMSGVDFGFHFATVVNTNDSGPGSLRQAITNANTLGGDSSLAVAGRTAGIEHVVFMLPNGSNAPGLRSSFNAFTTAAGGRNVATIAVQSVLPWLTSTLVLDARTQPGYAGAPVVELNGAAAPGGTNFDGWGGNTPGLMGKSQTGPAQTLIGGFVINRFLGRGLVLEKNVVAQGNWVGLNADGNTASANGMDGVFINLGENTVLGGTGPNDGNVISGNTSQGVSLWGGDSSTRIIGNRIGSNAAGTAALHNQQYGIWANTGAVGVRVGGAAAGEGNLLQNILVRGDGVQVKGNLIGTNLSGTSVWRAASLGVYVFSGSDVLIGGSAPGEGNVIAGFTNSGVLLQGGTRTVVQGNFIGTNAAGASGLGNLSHGVEVQSGASLPQIGGAVAGAGNVISGNLADGINVKANNSTIQGNLIGLDATGTVKVANGNNGIYLITSTGHLVGGSAAAARNVISGQLRGIQFNAGGTTTIQGNYIGTNAAGTAAVANNVGIALDNTPSSVTIGGAAAGAGNLISGNGVGISGAGSGHLIRGNVIGLNAARTGFIPNGSWGGVYLSAGTGVSVGGTGPGEGNTIAGNTGPGVMLQSYYGPVQAAVLGNSIYGNGGLGIDLTASAAEATPDGVTLNDGNKTANTPNQRMDHPVFTAARSRGNQLTVAGYVGSAANQSVFAGARVEVFASSADASGFGEGQTYLGAFTTDASGNFSGTITMPLAMLRMGTVLTGTATDASGNTSEFGANFSNLVADMVVNSTADGADATPGDGLCETSTAGQCTLRAALQEMNAWPSLVSTPAVVFALPGCSAGGQVACRISPSTPLPTVLRAMVIDGSTQAGFSAVRYDPIVEVSGATAPANTTGFVVNATGVTLRGLVINGWGNHGVSLGGSGHSVVGNWVGLNATGTAAAANAGSGIFVMDSGNQVGGATAADRNVVSGNTVDGIALQGAANTVIGNVVGLLPDGLTAAGNQRDGVKLYGADQVVGGAAPGEGNTISGNRSSGLRLESNAHRARIRGNRIGVADDGVTPRGNGTPNAASGIGLNGYILGGQIGGTAAGEGNTIAYSGNSGVGFGASTITRITVLGNSIFGNATLGLRMRSSTSVMANDGAYNNGTANDGIDYPVISGAGVSDNGTVLAAYGYIGTGTGQAVFGGARVEFFKAAIDPTGHGEGRLYLGALTADANGRFSGTLAIPAGTVAVAEHLTATATDANGNTSEFGPNWATTTMAELAPGGFNGFETGTSATAITGVITSKTADTAATLAVVALSNDGTSLHPGFTGTVALNWLDTRNNSGAATGSCRSSWVNLGSAGSVSFGGNARQNVALTPPANGTRAMRLQMVYAGPAGTVTACSSDEFAVLPASLSVAANDADAATAGTTRLLNNGSASGGVVHRAGRPFTVTVRALSAVGTLMSNYDGSPALAVSGCVLPVGCTAGTLSGTLGSATGGVATGNTLAYTEVGAIQLKATDTTHGNVDSADTTAAARTVASANTTVGRFVPDHYTLTLSTPGVLATANAACMASGSGATFFDQGFGWATTPQATLVARNAGGGTTAFWTGSLMKLSAAHVGPPTLSASNTGSTTLATSFGAVGLADLGGGQVRLTASSTDRFLLALNNGSLQPSLTPTWAWALPVADTSEAAVAGNPGSTAASATQVGVGFDQGAVFHHGRLALASSHGDARRGVRALVHLQRYSANGWVTLTDDRGCVTVAPGNLGVSSPVGVFTTAGVCAAPLAGSVSTRGGRAWLVLPATPGGQPGRLQLTLAGQAAAGSACTSSGTVQTVVPLGLPHLTGGSASTGTSAMATWGVAQRDAVLRREVW